MALKPDICYLEIGFVCDITFSMAREIRSMCPTHSISLLAVFVSLVITGSATADELLIDTGAAGFGNTATIQHSESEFQHLSMKVSFPEPAEITKIDAWMSVWTMGKSGYVECSFSATSGGIPLHETWFIPTNNIPDWSSIKVNWWVDAGEYWLTFKAGSNTIHDEVLCFFPGEAPNPLSGYAYQNSFTPWTPLVGQPLGLRVHGNSPIPFTTIQAAIDSVPPGLPPQDVLVPPGTYDEAVNFGGKKIKLRSLSGADSTTIDASGLNQIAVWILNTGAGSELEGFTITGGVRGVQVQGSEAAIKDCVITGNPGGGALVNQNGEATFQNCNFVANPQGGVQVDTNAAFSGCHFSGNTQFSAISVGGTGAEINVGSCTFTGNTNFSGGAVRIEGLSADATFSDCDFIDNIASSQGGGISIAGGSTADFTDCLFEGNQATSFGGGAIRVTGIATQATFTGCTIIGNQGQRGSAAIVNQSGDATFSNCEFTQNISSGTTTGTVFLNVGSAELDNCIFTNNHASNGGAGVHVNSNNSTVTATSCDFVENSSDAGFAAVLVFGTTANASFTECDFTSNTATGDGGGVGVLMGTASFTICNFKENSATSGGAMAMQGPSVVTIDGCTFDGNTATSGGGAMQVIGSTQLSIEQSDFINNTASQGGAIRMLSLTSPSTITDCEFLENQASTQGGALFVNTFTTVPPTIEESSLCGNTPNDIAGPWVNAGFNFFCDPPNDTPENAQEIELGAPIWAYFDSAENDITSTCHPFGPDLFFYFTTTGDASSRYVHTCWSESNTALAVYNSSMEEIACSTTCAFPSCESENACLWLQNLPADTYRVRVSWENVPLQGGTNLFMVALEPSVPSVPGDITGNGVVDVDDLLAVINAWGPCAQPDNCPADMAPAPGGNGIVDVDDLLIVINNWG
jgi:predicted outer membrane repeat protein